MSDFYIKITVFAALLAHIIVGGAVGRRMTTLSLLPGLDLILGLALLGYWVQRWFGAATHGYKLYLTDQLFPLYGLIVCVVSLMTMTGRISSLVPAWIMFAIHALVLIAATLFMMTFKMNRLI
ncbi:MAG: hypothetical protein ABJC26_16555 [Gemmatimonadaceae bacterium]